ncbi:vesicle transport v-SNARE 12 isoform X2 [Arabidopsis lyrata subsp. lyrata]|uniref:vesicle transport v-SNARE 12 isoform X2 n=1 Tax=Arabidopsis lyrata subsp. lyrata TaxID=81972 RepID=UPI000A29D945|nr:vesicle transport v-SNARE 12 isoform X2 [Arabidopsis lyrata subsp. lyrata]|eukprot:XP_020878378.1 vesicle transport v-SNARE 12 isoform X2 [Arabidopsis lyrata subsp. lyrata]
MESRVAEVSADQRGRLAMSVKRLDQSRDRVREIRRLMPETEEVGIFVFQDLNQQCQTLLHVHTKVVKIDGHVIGDGKVGRVTRTLQNAYKKRQRILVCQYLLTKTLKYKTRGFEHEGTQPKEAFNVHIQFIFDVRHTESLRGFGFQDHMTPSEQL